MTPLKLFLTVSAALVWTASGTAHAQSPQTGPARTAPEAAPASVLPPAEQEATVEDVVITARASEVRTSIGATIYSLADDLQAATGSLADAMLNVPSVEVDAEGNVSLRGDGNVTILVDGRPSSQFNWASRGQFLLQIPAGQYARIEVVTNPSAAYSPEGSCGFGRHDSRCNDRRIGTSMGSTCGGAAIVDLLRYLWSDPRSGRSYSQAGYGRSSRWRDISRDLAIARGSSNRTGRRCGRGVHLHGDPPERG